MKEKEDKNLMLDVESARPKSRIYYLDVLRVIACVAVVLIHASSVYVKSDIGSFNYWVGNVLDGLSRIAVPLFVMISGALVLDEKYDYKAVKLKKHIKKLIVFFVFWSAFYALIFGIVAPIINGESVNMMSVFFSFVQGHYHLWFIYLIIGLYLILPLLRLWVKKANRKYVKYFIVLAMIFTFLFPQIINIGNNYSNLFDALERILEDKVALCYVGGFTAYFLLGWYLNNFDLRQKKVIYWLGLLGLFTTIVGTYVLSVTTGEALQMYDSFGINVLLQSTAIFVFIKGKLGESCQNQKKLVRIISENSLGIYAIHVFIIEMIYWALDAIGFNLAIVNIPIVFALAFVGSFFTSFMLSKIPVLKNVV